MSELSLEGIRRAAQAAREFSVVCDHAQLVLRVPTPHEAELVVARAGFGTEANAGEIGLRVRRGLLEQAVVAWIGVTVGDVLPGHEQAADPLQLEPGAAALLLDARPLWAEALWARLKAETDARRTARESAAKN